MVITPESKGPSISSNRLTSPCPPCIDTYSQKTWLNYPLLALFAAFILRTGNKILQ